MEMRPRQQPSPVDGDRMGNVKVRRALTDRGSEPEPTGDGIRKSVAGNGSRRVVGSLAPSVRSSELEAAAKPLLHVNHEAGILGAGIIKYFPNTPEVFVDPQIRAGGVQGPQPARGSLRRNHHI